MEQAIEAIGLVKSYPKGVTALDGLSFSVARGTVFALLGPNGAGKSTAVKILTTLATPDGGKALVGRLDVVANPDAVRRTIGVVSQGSAVDIQATGRENLRLQGQIYGMRGQALERVREAGARGEDEDDAHGGEALERPLEEREAVGVHRVRGVPRERVGPVFAKTGDHACESKTQNVLRIASKRRNVRSERGEDGRDFLVVETECP